MTEPKFLLELLARLFTDPPGFYRGAQRPDGGIGRQIQHIVFLLTCRTFGVSETCCRYAPKLVGENEEMADLLVGLTNARRNWGFDLCFWYLRNVQGQLWNHKRVCRIYRELALNLRIKPRKRLRRDEPDGPGSTRGAKRLMVDGFYG